MTKQQQHIGGNAVSGPKIAVFLRVDGKLTQFEADTPNHEHAIAMVREHLGHRPIGRNGKWSGGPVLASIKGGKK